MILRELFLMTPQVLEDVPPLYETQAFTQWTTFTSGCKLTTFLDGILLNINANARARAQELHKSHAQEPRKSQAHHWDFRARQRRRLPHSVSRRARHCLAHPLVRRLTRRLVRCLVHPRATT